MKSVFLSIGKIFKILIQSFFSHFFIPGALQMTSKELQYTSILNSGYEFDFYSSSIPTKIPGISVILSTYNRCRSEGTCKSLLKRALESILNQTFSNFELVLIDDCSIDCTKEYCKEIAAQDPRVKFFHFKQNSGGIPAKRYNFGISVSRGKYVTFMFDDDQLELNALNDLYHAIDKTHKNCGMVYGISTHYYGNDPKNVEILGEKWGWKKIHSCNFIANNSVIVKRSVINLVGGYDEDPIFLRVCDWDLWWRIGRKFKIGRIQSKVGIVNGALSDSIGCTNVLDWDACKSRQRNHRLLPLQVIQKEHLQCKLRSILFDLYIRVTEGVIRLKLGIKSRLKIILPQGVYLFLKKVNNYLHKFLSNEH